MVHVKFSVHFKLNCDVCCEEFRLCCVSIQEISKLSNGLNLAFGMLLIQEACSHIL